MKRLGDFSRGAVWLAEAGLLLVLPLVFSREFPEQFSFPKVFLARILVLGGLAACGLNLVWNANGRLRRSALALPLGVLAFAVLLSCWNSPVPGFSLDEAQYFLSGPVFLLLLLCSERGEAAARRFATLCALAATVVAAVVLLQWAGHDPLLFGGYRVNWGKMVARMRLYGTFGNPNFVAGYLIAAVFLAAALAITASARRWRVLGWVAAAAMLAAILGTGSKGAWAGLLMGVFAAGAVWRFGSRRDTVRPAPRLDERRPGGVTLRSLAPAVAWLAAWFALGPGDRLLRLVWGRVYLWRFSWPMFAEHPWLGSGYGVYQLRYLELQSSFLAEHPELTNFWTNNRQLHNDPLQLLLETGLLGFGAFVWVLLAYGQELRQGLAGARNRTARIWLAASAGGVAAILVDSVFNYQFAVAPTFMLLFALLAFPAMLREEVLAPPPGQTHDAKGASGPRPSSAPGILWIVLRVAASLALLLAAAALLVQTVRHGIAERNLALAQQAESMGRLATAEGLYRRGLVLNPGSGRLHFGLARVLYRADRLPPALAEAQLAERTYADSHLEVLKARIQDKMGLAPAALQTYRHALALDPTLQTVQADIDRLRK